jgi:formylglycine-generating enzyme required for sulfatase activity
MRRASCWAVILLVVCFFSEAASREWQAFSVADVEELLNAGVTPTRMVALIEEHGIDFEATEEVQERLRHAGADAVVLAAIKQAGEAYAQKRSPDMQQAPKEKRGEETGQHTTEQASISENRVDAQEMVMVPAGDFWMGCNEQVDKECDNDEQPGRLVWVETFLIDRTEVTMAQYRQCVDAGACASSGLSMPRRASGSEEYPEWAWACNWAKAGRENHPINCVTWHQAHAFCRWAGKRLPTEAEWEKAARGTDGRKYPWGNRNFGATGQVANIADRTAKHQRGNWTVAARYDDGFYGTAPVGSFPLGASPYGALDMSGNVWEWTADWYDSEHKYRLLRGGSWSDVPRFARTSTRLWNHPDDRYMVVGFRCAK